MDSHIVHSKRITIEVYGLGYVGLPLSVKLASAGFNVVGIDKDPLKIERLNSNKLLSSEEFLRNDFELSKNSTKLSISESPSRSDGNKIGIICVPTPIPENNIESDKFVKQAVESFLINAKKEDIIILEKHYETKNRSFSKVYIEV